MIQREDNNNTKDYNFNYNKDYNAQPNLMGGQQEQEDYCSCANLIVRWYCKITPPL
jgi:hypothetical protein